MAVRFIDARIFDHASDLGVLDIVINLNQIVWFGYHPDRVDATLIKLTGENNALIVEETFNSFAMRVGELDV